eukprot:1139838-Pelagomonas_calceolata.AAC.8
MANSCIVLLSRQACMHASPEHHHRKATAAILGEVTSNTQLRLVNEAKLCESTDQLKEQTAEQITARVPSCHLVISMQAHHGQEVFGCYTGYGGSCTSFSYLPSCPNMATQMFCVSRRLAVVKKYVATAQGMQTYAQKRVGRALSDWKNLPAVHLLPDVQ